MTALKVTSTILGLVFLAIIGSVLSLETPANLSPEKIREMFPLAAEREYEIIPIHKSRLQKRGINGGLHLQLKAFGENIKLWLDPSEGTLASSKTPVWSLRGRFELVKEEGFIEKLIPLMYTERRSSAVMFIDEVQNGALQLYGSLGNNQYYIQPAHNVNYRRYGRSADNDTETHPDYSYHIIFKSPNRFNYLDNFPNPLKNIFNSPGNQQQQQDTVYPEIMVIIDYPLFEKMNHSMKIAVKYTLAFFNGVDLKYRGFVNPKYRLNIAGIIVTTVAGALDYTNHVYNTEPYYVNADSVLQGSMEWMGRLGEFIGHDAFDASITLTSRPLCTNKGNQCVGGSIGYAFVGLACEVLKYPNNPTPLRRNSGIVHDRVDFEGIRTTAHELGHLFGVNHDGDNMKNQNCNSLDGNIMTPSVQFTNRGSEWSYCSLNEFQEFLNKKPTCLYNKPKSGSQKISRFLPGQWADANDQCYYYVGTRAAEINEKICQKLLCLNPKNPNYYSVEFEAAEGTLCAPNSICLHSQCVPISQIQ